LEYFPSYHNIAIAFLLDLILGDKISLPHPVRWMGNAISFLEPKFRKFVSNELFSGFLFAIFLILSQFIFAHFIMLAAEFVHPFFGNLTEIILIYYCISAGSLDESAMKVENRLRQNDLYGAKKKVSWIVGRDVDNLSEKGVIRATVETVAENLVDGVISPIFYACIGGAPLALTYKMVNTLDSMVGYKNKKYIKFGKTSARIDDIMNLIPSRIVLPFISLAAQILSQKGASSFITALKEGSNHTSPNAGYPEAAFAGALEVKLNGPNYYHGKIVFKPYLGKKYGVVKINDIIKACHLMILTSGLWVGFIWLIKIVAFS